MSSSRLDGREFHAFGPENEKLRSPNFNFNCRSSHLELLEDLSLSRPGRSATDVGVVHWVPEQLNIKAVTGACKLIDGCSLVLCFRPQFQWYQLANATEIKSIQFHDSIVGLSQKIVSFTFTFTCLTGRQDCDQLAIV